MHAPLEQPFGQEYKLPETLLVESQEYSQIAFPVLFVEHAGLELFAVINAQQSVPLELPAETVPRI
jgi:hypothetical protein